MKTAAAYIRVSTDEQAEFSPDSQLKAIRKYAKEHDMLLPENFIFTDEGISGRQADKRPAFQQMIGIAKLKPKPFDVILLWKFSRFARSRQDSIVYKSLLRKQCGIDVVSVTEQLADDNTSVLIEALIEAMDEYYSLNLAEEVRRGMQEKFSRGGVVSKPPFGYNIKNGVFVPDSVNAPIVQMIYSDYISGMGFRQIAEKLNNMGVRTDRGVQMTNRTVEYILTNPAYIGKMRRSKNGFDKNDRLRENPDNIIIVDGSHEPIITAEIFEQAQAKRAENRHIYNKYERQGTADFMLKGLVRCSACGSALALTARTQALQCYKYNSGVCSVSHSIKLNKINSLVTEQIVSDLNNGLLYISVHEPEKPKAYEPPFAALLEKEQKRLRRVREAYEEGIDSLDEYKTKKAAILGRIDEINALKPIEIQPHSPQIFAENVRCAVDIIQNPNVSENAKNVALRSIISKIVFIKHQSCIQIFYKPL